MSTNGTAVQAQPDAIEALEARIAALEARIPGPIPPRHIGPGRMVALDDAVKTLGGFEGVSVIPDPSPKQRYHDRSTVIVCPTRGLIDERVITSWNGLIHAMNQRRLGPVFARGYEVGEAYNALISWLLEHPQIKTWKYVLTLEDDNLPPPDAHMKLLRAMEDHPEYAAISGLYHTKDPLQAVMAYGDPEHFKRTGKALHFPIDKSLLDPRNPEPVEVLGIPMGCTIWRMDLFREVSPSWFMTLSEKILVNGKLIDADKITNEEAIDADAKRCMTQDLAFCEVAIKPPYNKRFAVLPSLRVGHLNLEEGIVY